MKALGPLVALLSAACSYAFGGGDGTGGASASSSDVASSTSGQRDAQTSGATTDASTTAVSAASSSTGEAPLEPCALFDDPDTVFREDFGMGAGGRWQKSNDDNGADARVDMGEALLDLGDNGLITFTSKREIRFRDCYVIVEEVETTDEETEIFRVQRSASAEDAFFLSYEADDSPEPAMVADVKVDGVATGEEPVKRPRVAWRRLETRGERIRAAVGSSPTQWEVIFDGARPSWMNEKVVVVFELQNVDMMGSGDARFDDLNPP